MELALLDRDAVVQPPGFCERWSVVREGTRPSTKAMTNAGRPTMSPARSSPSTGGTGTTSASDRRQSCSRRRSYVGNIAARSGDRRTTTRCPSAIVTITVSFRPPATGGPTHLQPGTINALAEHVRLSGGPPAARRRSRSERLRRLPVTTRLAAAPDLDDLAVDHPEHLDPAVLERTPVTLRAASVPVTVTIVPSSWSTTVSKCSSGQRSSVSCNRSIVSCKASDFTSPAL